MAALATRFKAKAKLLLPQHTELYEWDEYIDITETADSIDDQMWYESEYIGGMATAILAILEQEDREEAK